jgi:hypothetical protein
MPTLARLTDLKTKARISSTSSDALLTLLLQDATGVAERLCGRPRMFREAAVVAYPTDDPPEARRFRVQPFPIESVSLVQQLLESGSDQDFADDLVATPGGLVLGVDYTIEADRGWVQKIVTANSASREIDRWWLEPRCVKIVYTGGYLDPDTAAGLAAWAPGMEYNPGDLVRNSGSGQDQLAYCCQVANTSASGDQPLSGSPNWARVWEVPQDLQAGLIAQAWRQFNKGNIGGNDSVSLTGGGGSVSFGKDEVHPQLEEACAALRFPEI